MGYNGAEMFFFNAIFCLTARTQNSKTMNANLEFQKPVPIKTHQDPEPKMSNPNAKTQNPSTNILNL